jgi:amino acid transporter
MEETGNLGRPKLTVWDAIAQSLAIGPVLSAVLLATLVAGAAGSAAPLATLIGGIGSICIGWAIVLFAQRYTGAGAVYEYVRKAVGGGLGAFSAAIYFIGAVFLGGAGIYLAIGFFSQLFFDSIGLKLPWAVWAIIAIGLVFVFNHFGVQTTTRTQLVLTVLAVLPILIIVVAIIAQGGASGNTLQTLNPSNPNAGNLFRGVLFAITLFIGFEAAASLSEETHDPKRTVPTAVIGTVAIAAVFYLLVLYASAIGFGLDKIGDWVKDPAPLSTLGSKFVGGWIGRWVDIALIVDMIAVASAFMATVARGFYALARDGLLPAGLASTSRYNTPLGGNILVVGLALLLTIITLLSGLEVMTVFSITALAGTLLINIIYIVLAVLALGLVETLWQYLILVIAIFTPILAIYGSIIPLPPAPINIAVWATAIAVLGAVVWSVAVRNRVPTEDVAKATD